MRLPRIRSNDAWRNATLLTPAELDALDSKTAQAINGDGGAYTPSGPIDIGGAGMMFTGSVVVRGAGARIETPQGKRITLGDGDFPLLKAGHTGRTRVLHSPCAAFVPLDAGLARWVMELSTSSPQTIGAPGGKQLVPLRVHDRSTFVSATFTFVVNGIHAGVPEVLPRFRVFQVDTVGTVTPLKTNGDNGYVTYAPAPANAAAWQTALPNNHTFAYACDVGVVVDKSRYSYFAEIQDESGQNAVIRTYYLDVACAFADIADLRQQ